MLGLLVCIYQYKMYYIGLLYVKSISYNCNIYYTYKDKNFKSIIGKESKSLLSNTNK